MNIPFKYKGLLGGSQSLGIDEGIASSASSCFVSNYFLLKIGGLNNAVT